MKTCEKCYRCVEDEADLRAKGMEPQSNDIPFFPLLDEPIAKPRKGVKVRCCLAYKQAPGMVCRYYEPRWRHNLHMIWSWRICYRARRWFEQYIRCPIGRLRKPKALKWREGYCGKEPVCPRCGEMPYSHSQCVFCGQRFTEDVEKPASRNEQTLGGMFLRFFLLLLAAVALALGIAHIENASAEGHTMTCIIPEGQYVNIRKQARLDSSAWGEARNGDLITAERVKDGWVEFDYDGNTAYALVKFFEIKVDADYIIDANGRVRIRETPNGSKLGYYAVGTVVHVDAWRYDKKGALWGRVGDVYVSSDFLTPVEDDDL